MTLMGIGESEGYMVAVVVKSDDGGDPGWLQLKEILDRRLAYPVDEILKVLTAWEVVMFEGHPSQAMREKDRARWEQGATLNRIMS